MNEQEERVHAHHCCKKHGCKYGDRDCPVAYGDVEQYYPCPDCDDYYDDDIDDTGALISEAIMKERRSGYEKERKSFWKGFISAVLFVILFHILLSYILL